MTPAKLDLVIYQGDSWSRTLTITDSEGAPLDLSTATPTCQIRDQQDVFQADVDIDDTDADEGVFVISLGADVTTDLVNGRWDFQLATGENIQTYLYGRIIVLRQVTRPVPP
jgi:hypothetical protein